MSAFSSKRKVTVRGTAASLVGAVLLGVNLILAGCAGLVGANNSTGSPTAPAITQVSTANITKNTAQVDWTTNVAATSQVQYGTSTNYGTTTPLDSTMITTHSVSLAALTANQTYHFSVVSTANGQTVTGADQTFTTANNAATITGLSPNSGSTAGGTQVTISGSNFVSGATVQFGGTTGTSVSFVSGTQLKATTPAHAAGAITVAVTNPSSPASAPFSSFTYTTATSALAVSTTSLSAGTVGTVYSASVQASGGTTPYTWSLSSGTLPAGLTLSSAGAISGTPTAAGTASFTVQVKDGANATATKSLSIVVAAAASVTLSINGSISIAASNGVPYSSTDQATGGTLPYSWSVTSGQLPTGLSLTSTTGNIAGTPTTNGQYTFTLQVTDSSTTKQAASTSYTISVSSSILDQFGGLTTMTSPNPSTGRFRVEKFSNKKWMFVDPANNGFFMIAPYVLNQDNSNDDMGSNYYARTNVKYGDNGPTWATAQLKRIQSWGFNSVGPYGSAYAEPIATDPRWNTPDHTNPVKVPFIALIRPAYYGMLNQNNWSPQPIKNMLYSLSPYYTGYKPGNGVADYYDPNLTTFFTNEMNNDSLPVSIKASPNQQYMIGVNADDSDEMYGFGKGPDFPGGHNNAHLGWLVLTMSPVQTANSLKKFVYPDTVVYSKRALHDQLVAKYGTIAALNSAWGSNYTTFDSSGTTVSGESLGTGNGSTTAFSKTLTGTIVSAFSVQILVGGKAVAGDNGSGTLWGPTASGTINYATGAISVTFSSAPATGPTVTANYIQNGWGIGTGLMDEDARPTHLLWTGIDFTFMADVNATVKADLDDYLFQIASHYFSMCRNGIQNWLPGTLYLGPDTLGSWGAPSNRNVLKAAAQYIDVMAMGGTPPMNQTMIDFIYTYFGDKPFYTGEFRTANGDSAFFRYAAAALDFSSQANRGQSYYNGVTPYPNMAYSANGSRPYVGILWWQYLDNWGEKNDWGLVSLSDNAYDGHESVIGTVGSGTRSIPCSPPLENYVCGGEERNYSNLIQLVTQAHQSVMQAVQK